MKCNSKVTLKKYLIFLPILAAATRIRLFSQCHLSVLPKLIQGTSVLCLGQCEHSSQSQRDITYSHRHICICI